MMYKMVFIDRNQGLNTVEPRLTNTLLRRTPHFNERFWPVPNILTVKSCLKTSPGANNLALPVQRTDFCPPNVSAHGVMAPLISRHQAFRNADCLNVFPTITKDTKRLQYDLHLCHQIGRRCCLTLN